MSTQHKLQVRSGMAIGMSRHEPMELVGANRMEQDQFKAELSRYRSAKPRHRRYASSRSTVDTEKIIRHAREAKAAAANARKPTPVVLSTNLRGTFFEVDARESLSKTVEDMAVVKATSSRRSPKAQRQMLAALRKDGMTAMSAIAAAL